MRKLPGILDVSFDMRTRVVTVSFDAGGVAANQIEQAIHQARQEMAQSAPREEQLGRLLGDE